MGGDQTDERYVCVDTETNDLFDFKRAADAEGQPRLAEAGLIFLDHNLAVTREYQAYVQPDGWFMTPGATKVNHITHEMLVEKGVPVTEVLDVYTEAIRAGYVVVGHHVQNECKIFRAELRRAKRDDLFQITRNICTMRGLVGVCKLEQKNGRGYKWPKLHEACGHYGIIQRKEHTALADAQAVVELLRAMKRDGVLPKPDIHYAKNRPMPEGGGTYEIHH